MTNTLDLKSVVRTIPNFPTQGIEFYDVNSIFENIDAWRQMVAELKAQLQHLDIDMIVGVESRGFLPVAVLSLELNTPFTMVRKPNKLPGKLHSYKYDLEYGSDTLEIQKTALSSRCKCLIVDDILATGGTANATAQLIKQAGGIPVAFSFMMELTGLGGRERLEQIAPMYTILDFPA